eukprot:jgi/Tetstr1/428006/TSEL_018079.t1
MRVQQKGDALSRAARGCANCTRAAGFHNVAGELDRANYKSPEYEDAHLTAMGWAQTEALQQHVAARKEQLGVELIV